MKVGFNLLLWTTHVTEDRFHLIEEMKKTGYDGVEIPLFEGDPEHFRKLGRVIADNGLGATTVTVMPDTAHDAVSPDKAARDGARVHIGGQRHALGVALAFVEIDHQSHGNRD